MSKAAGNNTVMELSAEEAQAFADKVSEVRDEVIAASGGEAAATMTGK